MLAVYHYNCHPIIPWTDVSSLIYSLIEIHKPDYDPAVSKHVATLYKSKIYYSDTSANEWPC